MSVDRDEVRDQLEAVLEPVEFPVERRREVERRLGPTVQYERIESGDFSMTVGAIANAVSGAVEYPYASAGGLVDDVLAELDRRGRL